MHLIAIPQPCHEKWKHMQPTATGRHCAACQESVVDFTAMSDAEVVAFLDRYPAVSCGRFSENQMDRPLYVPVPVAARSWRRWIAAWTTVLGLSQLFAPKASGQEIYRSSTGGPIPGASQLAAGGSSAATIVSNPTAPPVLPATEDLLVRGVVRNRWGLPMSKVRVRLEKSELHTTTDALGRFSLRVPALQRSESLVVRVSYKGFRGQYLEVEPERRSRYQVFMKRRKHITSGKFR